MAEDKVNIKNIESIERLCDPKYYLENFTKIKGKKQGSLVPFILKEHQKDLFNALHENNRVMILKSRQMGFCLDPETLVLTVDMKWVRIDDLSVGEELVAVDEQRNSRVVGGGRKIQKSLVENKCEVFDDAYRLTMDNGLELIATAKHRFLCLKNRRGFRSGWKTVEAMKPNECIAFFVQPWNDLSYKGSSSLGFVDKEEYVIEKEDGTKEWHGSKSLAGRDWWEGKVMPNGAENWVRVKSVECVGKRRMVDLQTSSKTFIANGFVSHNSTAMVGYFYHNTITNPSTTTALIGYNAALTAELLDKVKTFYKTTPEKLKPTIQYNSRSEITFPKINSKILILPSTVNVGRGYTLNNVLATELSSWEDAEDKMLSLEASVPVDGKIVIESTPRGQGNLYHQMWMSEDNGYIKKEYGWWWDYTKEEVDLIAKRMNNPQKFAQEYGLQFLSSGRNVFDQEIVKKQRDNVYKIGQTVKLPNGSDFVVHEEDHLTIYQPPEVGQLYVCGVDVAEGVSGGDFAVASIWKRSNGEEVAKFRGQQIAPDLLGNKLNKWGRKYNNALMVVEVNNHGLTTLTILKQLLYPSIYFRPTKLETIGITSSDKMGWRTTRMTRELLIDDFAQSIRDGDIIIHSKELIDELSVMIYDNRGVVTAPDGYYDDFIFSAAIAMQGFKVMYDKPLKQLDHAKYLPVGFSY